MKRCERVAIRTLTMYVNESNYFWLCCVVYATLKYLKKNFTLYWQPDNWCLVMESFFFENYKSSTELWETSLKKVLKRQQWNVCQCLVTSGNCENRLFVLVINGFREIILHEDHYLPQTNQYVAMQLICQDSRIKRSFRH